MRVTSIKTHKFRIILCLTQHMPLLVLIFVGILLIARLSLSSCFRNVPFGVHFRLQIYCTINFITKWHDIICKRLQKKL